MFKRRRFMTIAPELDQSSRRPGRVIRINEADQRQPSDSRGRPTQTSFCSNAVRTAQYTAINFIPKNLIGQFRRIANVYFLMISLLQLCTDLSPTNEYSTIGPLTMVLMATMVKEGIEDRARHLADKKVNSATTSMLDAASGQYKQVEWQEVKVGSIIHVQEKESIPADMVIIASSEEGGVARVETSNLDGETNLKSLDALSCGSEILTENYQLKQVDAEILCEQPNDKLYQFDGTISYRNDSGETVKVPISINNLLLRGTTIRQTRDVYGVVVNTGMDTKLMQNSKPPPSKFSHMDTIVNRGILLIFLILFLFCTVSTILGSVWLANGQKPSQVGVSRYLPFVAEYHWGRFPNIWVTYLILYNNLVPISLYICLEMVKWYQARNMETDPSMIDPETNVSVTVRTSNLNEDVGQVSYVFTDKTGTLTRNEMVFRACSVANCIYDGTDMKLREKIGSSCGQIGAKRNELYVEPIRNMDMHIAENPESNQAQSILDFMRCVALCHTASYDMVDGVKSMRATSADEAALLLAAKELQFPFLDRKGKVLEIMIQQKVEKYEIVALNEFDSMRKCMSIVLKREDGSIVMFCKGADSVIMSKCKEEAGKGDNHNLLHHIHYFAAQGLRTLAFAKREIDEATFNDWYTKYEEAQTIIGDRAGKLMALAHEMEQDVVALGVTGVEDRLQDGVPECIRTLSRAGIHIWMLTGDKDETAISVAYSCGLLTEESCLAIVDGTTRQDCLDQIASYRMKLKKHDLWLPGTISQRLALVINGTALECLLTQGTESAENPDAAVLLEFVSQCVAVVSCRLCPMQKAQLVRLMRNSSAHPITMAIGDGGNDVSMIQEAHIGVGVHGNEGMSAVRAADFSLGQFRFIKPLILVHGRWNYRRVALVILYCFYKNMALITTLFFYSFSNGYSGQTMYESYLMVGWNVAYTLFPLIVLGILDQDISEATVLTYPWIYRRTLQCSEFQVVKLATWCGNAVLHSLIVFFLTYRMNEALAQEGGTFLFGTMVYGILLFTVTIKAALTMQRFHRWTKWHHFSMYASLCLYFIFVGIYSKGYAILPTLGFLRDFSGIGDNLLTSPNFWLTLPLVAFASIIVDIGLSYFNAMYLPSLLTILQEVDSKLAPPLKSVDSDILEMDNSSYQPQNAVGRLSLLDEATLSKLQGHNLEFDGPSDYEQLKRQLMALERLTALCQGKPDPFLRSEQRQSAQFVAANASTHFWTLEFTGKKHKHLEVEYNSGFVRREARRFQTFMTCACVLFPVYAVYGSLTESSTSGTVVRIGQGLVALLYRRYSYTNAFIKYYQASVLVPLAIGGVSMTMTITDKGQFSSAIFPFIIFSVVRVRFVYAVIVAFANYLFYVFSESFRSTFSSFSKTTDEDKLVFALYMIFVGLHAAHNCYKVQMAMRRDFLQHRSLKFEQQRSTEILHNMFPRHVSKRLQNGYTLISDAEPDVTVLFCDIVDFRDLLERYTAHQLVSLLDRVYSLFDEICRKHQMHKMETVGKTYMACAGLQGSCEKHAIRAAEMAEDMLQTIEKCRTSSGHGIRVRIGMHSGRVISGLVGMKKQQFSLFGDTVNTASRMQSTGVDGRCQMSDITYNKLGGLFECEERSVEAKGKGKMRTYLLGKRHDGVDSTSESMDESLSTQEKVPVARHSRVGQLGRVLKKYDPFVYLFGEPEDVAEEEEMQSEIHPFWLTFKRTRMEKLYQESVLPARIQASQRCVAILGLYTAYQCLADAILYLQCTKDEECSISLEKKEFFFVLVFRAAFFALILVYGFQLSRMATTMSDVMNRNCNCALFGAAALAVLLAEIWLSDFRYENESDRYVRMCLDLVMLCFIASTGGAVTHKTSMIINVGMFLITCGRGIVIAGRTENFESYPIILSNFVIIANMFASRGVEFFTRRKIWLKHQTEREIAKAEQLLYQMLPGAVVAQLKRGEAVCHQHQNVGILFSDIKGFTSISSRAETKQVVQLLQSLFTAFDNLLEKHSVFKMQTIGDAYVIVSGLPFSDTNRRLGTAVASADSEASGDISQRVQTTKEHLMNLILMAQDMHDEVKKLSDPTTGEPLQMRIGVHLGNIIAGVIGTTTLRYDMWGPDPLTANELESNGVPEKTLISAQVHEILGETQFFDCSFYKTIDFKNAGLIDTYLISRKEHGVGEKSSDDMNTLVQATDTGEQPPGEQSQIENAIPSEEPTVTSKVDEQVAPPDHSHLT